jgi:hypothetical protein
MDNRERANLFLLIIGMKNLRRIHLHLDEFFWVSDSYSTRKIRIISSPFYY